MTIFLAVLAGLMWAMSDYLNARAGRIERSITVVFTMQLIGIVLFLPFVLLGDSQPTVSDLLLGFLAGLAGNAGLVAFIKGASTHQMGIVVPISAAAGAVVPVVVGLSIGDRYGVFGRIGIVFALFGIVLVTLSHRRQEVPAGSHRLAAATWGVVSGVLFGVVYSLLGVTSEESGLWPLIAGRLAVVPLGLIAIHSGARLLPRRSSWPIVAIASTAALSGLALYTLAAQLGPLGVAAVITSMSPAGTIAFARFIDREHVSALRFAGIVVSLIAIGLLSAN